ncbi:uncharacterized protein [Clytia hemisphaerica]|uniref:Cnidarian restricted protein n=1 Tax=Clytia hemisphaerica TaxID=252671 RepID=A0A7M5UTG3_9CNID|eukprot:TCONS_00003078-protein
MSGIFRLLLVLISLVISDFAEAEKKVLIVRRNNTFDTWTEPDGGCANCACRKHSSYMVTKSNKRSCFDNDDVSTIYGKDSILTSKEGQAIFYATSERKYKSWIVKNTFELYSSEGKQITSSNCQNVEISKVNVMNFDYWQPWITKKKIGDHFRLLKLGKLSAISIMIPLTNYATLRGHLVNIVVSCGNAKEVHKAFNVFVKFGGQRNYTKGEIIKQLPSSKSTTNDDDESSLNQNSKNTPKTSSLTMIVIGASLGGVAFLVIIVAIILFILNKRLKEQHMAVIKKQENGLTLDGSRVIVNKDVLELAHEIIQERAEKMKSRPDIIPEQEKELEFKFKMAKDLYQLTDNYSIDSAYEKAIDPVKSRENAANDTELSLDTNTGSLERMSSMKGSYTEIILDPKEPLNVRQSVIYEPVIDEKSGYSEPNHDVLIERPYQGIYLQPVDGGGGSVGVIKEEDDGQSSDEDANYEEFQG